MGTLEKQKYLKKNISSVNDDDFIDKFYTEVFAHLKFPETAYKLTEKQKKELDRRVELHKSGKSKSYTWEEVKQNLGIL